MIIIEVTIDTLRYVTRNAISAMMNIASFSILFSFLNISLFLRLNNFIRYNIIPIIKIAIKMLDIIEGRPPIHLIGVFKNVPGFREYGMKLFVPRYIGILLM